MMPAPRALLALLDVGGPEVLLILMLVLLLFGSKRMPEVARGMGKAIREFKKATGGLEEELRRAMDPPSDPPSPYPRQPPPPVVTLPLPPSSSPVIPPAASPAPAPAAPTPPGPAAAPPAAAPPPEPPESP